MTKKVRKNLDLCKGECTWTYTCDSSSSGGIRSREAAGILCVDSDAFTRFRSSGSPSAASSLRSPRRRPYLQTHPETCAHVPASPSIRSCVVVGLMNPQR